MLDFDHLNRELDAAGNDIEKIHRIIDNAKAEIEAAPDDQKQILIIQFQGLCLERAKQAKQVLDAFTIAW
jgi:hypothetical protein